jgi:hypothetical protein
VVSLLFGVLVEQVVEVLLLMAWVFLVQMDSVVVEVVLPLVVLE